jgi:hypothetical protein
MGQKGIIGNAISYAPASANNVVSTDIPKYNNGKIGNNISTPLTHMYSYIQ